MKKVYICSNCKEKFDHPPGWGNRGQCPSCDKWGTFQVNEVKVFKKRVKR